jgi:hypothetical protein
MHPNMNSTNVAHDLATQSHFDAIFFIWKLQYSLGYKKTSSKCIQYSSGIVTSNAPKLTLRPENRDLYVLLYITIICVKE